MRHGKDQAVSLKPELLRNKTVGRAERGSVPPCARAPPKVILISNNQKVAVLQGNAGRMWNSALRVANLGGTSE